MPSVLKANHTFLGSFASSSRYFLTIFLHCDPSAGALNFPSFLRSSLCHHIDLACFPFLNRRFNRGIRSIPHHLRRNPLPVGLAVNITRVISSDLIPQCTAYGACVQILVCTTV